MSSGPKPKWPYPVEKLLICQLNQVLKTGVDFSVVGIVEENTKSLPGRSSLHYIILHKSKATITTQTTGEKFCCKATFGE